MLKWLPEAPALVIAGVPRGTWSSWAKQGIVERPANGAYGLAETLRAAVIALLRATLAADDLPAAARALHRSNLDRQLAEACTTRSKHSVFDLVIEPATGRVTLVRDANELVSAVRHPGAPRAVVVLPLAAEMERVYEGFLNRATSAARPATRRPGRPRKLESVGENG